MVDTRVTQNPNQSRFNQTGNIYGEQPITHEPSRREDPFFNLDRILQGEKIAQTPKPQMQPQMTAMEPYSALRPAYSSNIPPNGYSNPPQKANTNWNDLEAEISQFTHDQKQYTKNKVPQSQEPSYQEQAYEPPPVASYANDVPARRSSSGFKTIAAIVGIAVLGTTGVLAYRGIMSSSNAPKVIKASTTPEKVAIAPPVKDTAPKSVLERAPNAATAPTLVPRDEKPLNSTQQAEQTTGAKVITSDLDEPRKVRTVSITADGQGNAVIRPTVASTAIPAAMPSITTGSIDTSQVQGKPVRTQSIAMAPVPAAVAPKAVEAPKPVAPKPAPSVMTPKAEAKPAATRQVASAPPQSSGPLALGPQAANAAPRPATTPSAAATPSGTYVVQVGNAKSETEARSSYRSMQGKHSVLEGRSANYIKADSNGNSIYRIRLSPTTKEAADQLCTRLKSSGGACFVTRG